MQTKTNGEMFSILDGDDKCCWINDNKSCYAFCYFGKTEFAGIDRPNFTKFKQFATSLKQNKKIKYSLRSDGGDHEIEYVPEKGEYTHRSCSYSDDFYGATFSTILSKNQRLIIADTILDWCEKKKN